MGYYQTAYRRNTIRFLTNYSNSEGTYHEKNTRHVPVVGRRAGVLVAAASFGARRAAGRVRRLRDADRRAVGRRHSLGAAEGTRRRPDYLRFRGRHWLFGRHGTHSARDRG